MRSSWFGMLIAAASLAACGGGSGSASTSGEIKEPVQLPAGPKTYLAAKPTVGDYYTYVTLGSDGSPLSLTTRLVNQVSGDGSVTYSYLEDGTYSPWEFASSTTSKDFDNLGRWLKSTDQDCVQTSLPLQHLVALNSIAVGMNWQYSGAIQGKCVSAPTSWQVQDVFTDKVVGEESVTVEAGTFNTLKVVRSETTSEAGSFQSVLERTCWWEPDLGVEVKCTTKRTTTNSATGRITTRSYTDELRGFSNQKLSRKFDTVLRFAGTWKGSYTDVAAVPGAELSQCAMTIDVYGNVNGYCPIKFSGKVSADGTLTLTVAPNTYSDASITGKFDSMIQMSGNWSVPNKGSGTWILTQD